MNKKASGFSLIELMIVIAILGVLAAVTVPSYQKYVYKSKMGELLSALSAAELATAEYVLTTGASGALSCELMPIVADEDGAFAYPISTIVSSVTISENCNITVVGADGEWGINDAPTVTATATIDDTGISWECSSGGVSFAPNSCP